MHLRPLGGTGPDVSEIGLGAWGLGGPVYWERRASGYGASDEATALATVRRALDRGVTFFDTAPQYGDGRSERLIGRALRGRRHEVYVETKVGMYLEGGQSDALAGRGTEGAAGDTTVGDTLETAGSKRFDFSAEFVRRAIDGSLRRLQMDYVDCYVLHSPSRTDWRDDGLEALHEIKRAGKARFVGVSLPGLGEGLLMALELLDGATGPRVDVLQVPFNLLDPAAARELLPRALERGVGIVVREPLAAGYLAGAFTPDTAFGSDDLRAYTPRESFLRRLEQVERFRFLERPGQTLAQAALRYVLAHPGVSTVIQGAKTPAELDENVAAVQGALRPEDLAQIRTIQEELSAGH